MTYDRSQTQHIFSNGVEGPYTGTNGFCRINLVEKVKV